MSLLRSLKSLRPQLAQAAQAVIDGWQPDEEGWDEEFGAGGACDRVADAMEGVILDSLPGVHVTEGGHDGDDHAWLIVYDDSEAAAVDIPPDVYETGGGYSWEKIEGAVISSEDVILSPLRREDVVDDDMDINQIAARIAGVSVARRKPKTQSRKKAPKSRAVSISHEDPMFSCRVEIDMTVNFEGGTSKSTLIKKLQGEVFAALESSIEITSRGLNIEAKDVNIRPVRIECAATEGTPPHEED